MTPFTQSPFVHLVGWTLLHFIWQGAAVAALLSLSLWLARTASSTFRYTMSCLALLAMAAFPPMTALYLAPNLPPIASGNSLAPGALNRDSIPSIPRLTVQTAPRPESNPAISTPTPSQPRTSFDAERVLPWMVLGWMAGVLTLSLRLLAGIAAIRRIRTRMLEPASARVHGAFRHLMIRMRITQPVQLFVSGAALVPVTLGFFKPVILLPISAVTGLTARQLELIIAHELAHIRRHDYLVNLIQSIIETVLFYHPAVWHVSHIIRSERENCCDDLAVAVCDCDGRSLATALARLEETRNSEGVFAMSAHGGGLAQRVRRLVGATDRATNPTFRCLVGLAAPAIVALIVIAGAMISRAQDSTNPSSNVRESKTDFDFVTTHTTKQRREQKGLMGNQPFTLSTGPDGQIKDEFSPNGELTTITATGGITLERENSTVTGEKMVITPGGSNHKAPQISVHGGTIFGTADGPSTVSGHERKLATIDPMLSSPRGPFKVLVSSNLDDKRSAALQEELDSGGYSDVERQKVNGRYLVLVGALNNKQEAQNLLADLRAAGYNPQGIQSTDDASPIGKTSNKLTGQIFRVLVSDFPTKDAAEESKKSLLAADYYGVDIVQEGKSYKVYIGAFPTEAEAQKMSAALLKDGYSYTKVVAVGETKSSVSASANERGVALLHGSKSGGLSPQDQTQAAKLFDHWKNVESGTSSADEINELREDLKRVKSEVSSAVKAMVASEEKRRESAAHVRERSDQFDRALANGQWDKVEQLLREMPSSEISLLPIQQEMLRTARGEKAAAEPTSGGVSETSGITLQHGGPFYIRVASNIPPPESFEVVRQLKDDGFDYIRETGNPAQSGRDISVCNFESEATAAQALAYLRSKGYQFGSVVSGKLVRKWRPQDGVNNDGKNTDGSPSVVAAPGMAPLGTGKYTPEQVRTMDIDVFFQHLGREPEPGFHQFSAMWALTDRSKNGTQADKDAILAKAIDHLDDQKTTDAARWHACYVLSGSGDPRAIPVLARVLREDKNETERGVAACALNDFSQEEAHKALEAAADTEKNPRVLEWIHKALSGELRKAK